MQTPAATNIDRIATIDGIALNAGGYADPPLRMSLYTM
jgi:hypothetical protein